MCSVVCVCAVLFGVCGASGAFAMLSVLPVLPVLFGGVSMRVSVHSVPPALWVL